VASGSFAYSQVRLQARLGTRLAPPDLQRLRATRDLPSALQAARATSASRHVERLAPTMTVHEIERRLRGEWALVVREVAGWQPARWRAAIEWLRWLPYLPALQKLARAGRPPAWSRLDPVLGPLVGQDPRERAAALLGTPLEPLGTAFGAEDPHGVVQAWLRHWRSLWPQEARSRRGLEEVVRRVVQFDGTLRNAPASGSIDSARAILAAQLQRVFRRHPVSPAAAAAYLGLEALALSGLRGALTARAVVLAGRA